MAQYMPPLCYNCKNFKENPKFIGDSGKCTKYPNNIPKDIFYKAGNCKFFTDVNTTKPTPKRRKK